MFPHEITPELALEPKHRAANFAVACSDLGTFAYDATNRIKSRTGGLNYDWSDRGTLTTDGERSFTWNRANELTADSQGGSFGYDANGWRMRKSRDGTLEYFVYNHAHQLMLRWNDTTQTETDFVYLGGKSLARIEGGQTTYIQPDYHGSPLFETGPNGSIARQPFYLGYGRTTADGRSKIPGYTGAAMDVTTGHTYLGARYLYHKRFTSPDPAGLDPTSPTGLNRYAYASDNPIRFVDPLGLQACEGEKDCIEATNYKSQDVAKQTVTQDSAIDEAASALAGDPTFETTGNKENAARFDESGEGKVKTTRVRTESKRIGNTISTKIYDVEGADAIAHSHPKNSSYLRPGPFDDKAVNSGYPNNIVHDGNVIVIEKVNGQFRVRFLKNANIGIMDRRGIQQYVNKFQQRIQ